MSELLLIAAGVGCVVVGIGAAAYVLRWELRYQRRVRRHGGYLVGGER